MKFITEEPIAANKPLSLTSHKIILMQTYEMIISRTHAITILKNLSLQCAILLEDVQSFRHYFIIPHYEAGTLAFMAAQYDIQVRKISIDAIKYKCRDFNSCFIAGSEHLLAYFSKYLLLQ